MNSLKEEMPRVLLALFLVTGFGLFGQSNQTLVKFIDRDGFTIFIKDTLSLKKPIDFKFLKNNLYAKLILPTLDSLEINNEFTILSVKPLEGKKRYELRISTQYKPIKKGVLGHYGIGTYYLEIGRNKKYVLKKFMLLNAEI